MPVTDKMLHIQSIPELYAGRSVFITGATGFMGKVLVEKLLRSCPKIDKIYLLVRPKKGVEPQKRIADLTECELFSELSRTQPDFREKIVGIEGDLMMENLGISVEDRDLLTREVSVVFHSAATVRFDEPLRVAVEMNMVGVQRMLELAHQMPKLDAFVHVSTAYANCDRLFIEEKIYPATIRPQQVIDTVRSLPDDMLVDVTGKLLGNRPNTYTYTKAMAEVMMQEAAASGLPITIVRPSIVGATLKDPFPGWVDNMNGPTGLFAAVGKGALRIMYGTSDAIADIIPVDTATNMMIAAGWFVAIQRPDEVPVYNCTTGSTNPVLWGYLAKSCERNMTCNPLDGVARLPRAHLTTSRIRRNVNVVLDHYVPACMMDIALQATGKKPKYFRLQSRMWKAMELMEFFTTHSWQFATDNVFSLINHLSDEDKENFDCDVRKIVWVEYFRIYCLGAKKHVLKDDMANMDVARQNIRSLQHRGYFINLAFGIGLWWVFYKRSDMVKMASTALYTWCLTQVKRLPAIAAVPHK